MYKGGDKNRRVRAAVCREGTLRSLVQGLESPDSALGLQLPARPTGVRFAPSQLCEPIPLNRSLYIHTHPVGSVSLENTDQCTSQQTMGNQAEVIPHWKTRVLLQAGRVCSAVKEGLKRAKTQTDARGALDVGALLGVWPACSLLYEAIGITESMR